jgi:hypothetical protein
MKAFFAIPKEENIGNSGLGYGWFMGILFILLIATFFMAAILEKLLRYMRSIWEALKDFSFSSNPVMGTPGNLGLSAPAYGVRHDAVPRRQKTATNSSKSTNDSGSLAWVSGSKV